MTSWLRLMEYNPHWRQEFEQTRSSLLQATEGWIRQCEHIGSTSVEGSIARPTIDLLAGLADLSGLNEAAMMIEGLNYRRLATPTWCDDELAAYLEKPRTGHATHSVLAVRIGSKAWNACLKVRDQLRENLVVRQQLDAVKQEYFLPGCSAEVNYTAAKDEFFSRLP